MESIIMAIRLTLRRAWRSLQETLDRTGLRSVPPVPTILAVIALGVGVPMAFGVDDEPAALRRSLAIERLERFARAGDRTMPGTTPESGIFSARPTFIWKAQPNATRYRFSLYQGDVLRHHTDRIKLPKAGAPVTYRLPAPGSLDEGPQYRMTVEGLDAAGQSLGQSAYTVFHVKSPEAAADATNDAHLAGLLTQLRSVRAQAVVELDSTDAALVLAGIYAEIGSLHDVRSALAAFLAESPNDPAAPLARSLLGYGG
ncbi:MAG: hypothetical protein ACYTGN_12465 [Planctomycetota bacterium]|jgi:hypothetical protein